MLNKALRFLLVTNGLVLLAGAMLGPIYALFIEDIGGNLMDVGYVAAVFSLTAGVTTLISGRFSDKIKENEWILVIGYSIIAIGFFLMIFVNSLWQLLVVEILIGLGEAIYASVFDSIYTKHIKNPKKAGSEWAVWEMMSYFTAALGALIGAFIAQSFGFSVMFIIMTIISISSAVFIAILPRKVL